MSVETERRTLMCVFGRERKKGDAVMGKEKMRKTTSLHARGRYGEVDSF